MRRSCLVLSSLILSFLVLSYIVLSSLVLVLVLLGCTITSKVFLYASVMPCVVLYFGVVIFGLFCARLVWCVLVLSFLSAFVVVLMFCCSL
jgi:hypothetical protein